MIDESANPKFYDADSRKYDEQRWTSRGGAYTNAAQQRIVASLCAAWRDSRIVEVGPGTARFTIPLARRGNRMTLVDISPGMLETAQQNLDEAGCGGQVDGTINGSIYELPFDDGAFDHAISINVFNHLERPEQALAELARVTRPGSTLLFNYANLRSIYWPAARRINAQRKAVGQDVYSVWERPARVRAMIADAGLTLVQRVGHAHLPRGLARLPVWPVLAAADRLVRRGPLAPIAPTHYCLCRKDA